MIDREEFYYDSCDGKTKIRALKWKPDKEPVAVFQIVHGMAEHIERYDGFAGYLANKGYIVVANDHIGHGKSVTTNENWGYFCEKNAVDVLINDANNLRVKTQHEYSELPYFILGHSMGSFILRNYITRYGDGLSGAIIMGTGDIDSRLINMGKKLVSVMAKFKGWKYKSKFVSQLVVDNNNKHFKNDEYTKCWLTKDRDIVKQYIEDPASGFRFTLNGFNTLFDLAKEMAKPENIKKIPTNLPVLMVSGEEDYLGQCGKGVLRVYKTLSNAGINDITWKLYPTDRHEILNELDKEDVYTDIEAWLNVRLKS